jgi:DNA-binding transcriptional regulator PaaX
MNSRLGKNQQKLLILLLGGLAIGLSRSPRQQYRTLQGIITEWKKIDAAHMRTFIEPLYKSKLITQKINTDGSISMILTDKGRKRALRYHLDALVISRPKKWNGKWHVVMYDIPEDKKTLRYELHRKITSMGFVELQHSVFVHPYECIDQIEFLIEAYDARPYIRRLVAEEIDITEPIKRAFSKEARRVKVGNRQRV